MDDPHPLVADSLSHEDLVVLVRQDTSYFTYIVKRFEDPLLRYIVRLGVQQREDREDLLQEIFIKVFRNLNNFDDSLKFSSWIYRIAHNETMSWYRKYRVRPEGHLIADADDMLPLVSTSEPSAEALFDREVSAQVLRDALGRINEKYRDVLILRFFEHKEYEEISDILLIPVSTVGTLIRRGKQQLKKQLSTDETLV